MLFSRGSQTTCLYSNLCWFDSLQDHADLALPIAVLADSQAAQDQLEGRLQKLKGGAGMIGAIRVMRLAGAGERALQEGRSISVVEGMLKQLSSALTALREEAQPFLERQPQGDVTATETQRGYPTIRAAARQD
jgi:hypothetical protein